MIIVFIFSSKLNCIILKKVGKIGGDDKQVKNRIRHIISTIDRKIGFSVSEVRVFGAGPRPPIYEVVLGDSESADALRKSFARYTRKRSPVTRPPELDGVEVYNSVTPATRVRISILRVSISCSSNVGFLVSVCFSVSCFVVCYYLFISTSRQSLSVTSSFIPQALWSFRASTLGQASGSRPPRVTLFAVTGLWTLSRSSTQLGLLDCWRLISRCQFVFSYSQGNVFGFCFVLFIKLLVFLFFFLVSFS